MSETDALTQFLLARIAEDEMVARRAVGRSWDLRHTEWFIGTLEAVGLDPFHVGAYRPDRVLAECAAKRWIVEAKPTDSYGEDVWTSHALALASVYDDHRDYQQKWKLEYVGKCPPHEWTDRGTPGDYWRECWLCGAQTASRD